MSGKFKESKDIVNYWEERYSSGRNSGQGSYGEEAKFKADCINHIIKEMEVKTLTEIGCGDGNQLGYINVDNYYGYDISPTIIKKCTEKYKSDETKHFSVINIDDYSKVKPADMIISLDVIFHLVTPESFDNYMKELFSGKYKVIAIYTMRQIPQNTENMAAHVKANDVMEWKMKNCEKARILDVINFENKDMAVYLW